MSALDTPNLSSLAETRADDVLPRPRAMDGTVNVERTPAEPSRVLPVWSSVFAQMVEAGPFLSPTWVRTWAEVYGARLGTELVTFAEVTGQPVGVCLLTPSVRYSAILPHVRLHLNTDGEPSGDSVIVEHNALMAEPAAVDRIDRAFAAHIEGRRVDELRAAGVDEHGVERLIAAFPRWRADVEWRDSHYVDLDRLRAGSGDHLQLLSRNTREQVRRSLARYRTRGELAVQSAQTIEEAERMLDQLIALHQARWNAVGSDGAFASSLRQQFHRAFIRRGLASGNAQLLRVTAGDQVIAVLYNLHANGKINFYQSGVAYEDDKHLKPGLVAHHLAITYCLQAGYSEYDFLISDPGEGRYKASLSDAHRRLGWVTLYRPGWRQRYFDAARRAREEVRRLRALTVTKGAQVTAAPSASTGA
jgi:CelD/BcsL family acetyltransferase involved in cellulose biosynthesis